MPKHPKKKHLHHHPIDEVATIILAGGQGTRLFPLTKTRCKPAVHFGGQYRLIDIPISNSLNSGIPHIFVISQYLAATLNNHVKDTFQLDSIQGGWIELLHPQEVGSEKIWYEGTADAVRKNLSTLKETPSEYFLILSGDQLYNMDLEEFIEFTQKKDVDMAIATLPVGEEDAKRMGVMQIDENQMITSFYEKPQEKEVLDQFRLPAGFTEREGLENPSYLASMGIYVFKRDALFSLLESDQREDFGKHLIVEQLKRGSAAAYYYDGYWEDIGTVTSYFKANLALTKNSLGLNLYDETNPIISQHSHLPSARIIDTQVKDSIICQGSVIKGAVIENSVIGPRVKVGAGTVIKNSILMGNQFYEVPKTMHGKLPKKLTIGERCHIENTIIDEHACIEDDVTLINEEKVDAYEDDKVVIRDGIIIVLSGAQITKGYKI